jgi:ribonuclease G
VERELIVNSSPTEVEIALTEKGKLVELHRQQADNNFTVGDIFLGSVKKLIPGLNAAFIDIGYQKEAFLHYTDLGPQLKSLQKFMNGAISEGNKNPMLDNFKLLPDINKHGKIDQVLEKRKPLLVQILKEPISTKGPRLTCEITIPGRYLVLTPFSKGVSVSKKIANPEERNRLKFLLQSIKPQNFGVIIRTAAEGKKVADLHEEVNALIDKWKSLHKQLHKSSPPQKLLSELDKPASILRDILNDSFNRIVVNDKAIYDNIYEYLGTIDPEKKKILKLHKSSRPIFQSFNITKQIKSSFGKTSTMPSGAYLVIEHTEALHVVDVNSGPKMRNKGQEDSAIAVNLESAEEIARQLRLRDLGGIIIIDFIDMRNNDNKKLLYNEMKKFMANDRAQHTILPLSRFGLMQITRQRVKPAVKIKTAEVCHTCNGTGEVSPNILVTENIERDLKFIMHTRPSSALHLHVHPFVFAYLKKGLPSLRTNWYFKYSKWIRLHEDSEYSVNEYRFFDGNHDEIRLN